MTKGELKVYQENWYLTNRKRLLKYRKDYYKSHKELFRKKYIKWATNNPERRKELGRIQYRRNPLKFQRRKKLWKKLNWSTYRFSRLYSSIKSRCTNPNSTGYKNYGGRGVKNFLYPNDLRYIWIRDHANRMKQPTIDRIDNNGDYELSNCRFIELVDNVKRRWYQQRLKLRV